MGYKKIPKELQELDQWVIATKSAVKDEDKIPLNAKTGGAGDPVNSKTWSDFATAVAARRKSKPHLGFVLSQNDPYTIIDLDDPYDPTKKWDDDTRKSHADFNADIMDKFPSYTEISQSGTGVHIIVRGKIPKGVNKETVELYSSQRYMITTGNVYKDLPIIDCQDNLDKLFAYLAPVETGVDLMDIEQTEEDDEIYDKACAAANGSRFLSLFNDPHNDTTNSEDDYALMQFLAFYSECDEQVIRMFRASAKGQRKKAYRDDYVNRNMRKIRGLLAADKKAKEVDMGAMAERLKMFMKDPEPDSVPEEKSNDGVDFSGIMAKALAVSEGMEIPNFKPKVAKVPDYALPPEDAIDDEDLVFPAGLIGEVAEYFYASAAKPVRTISLVASIGFLAGIVGREYNVSSVGLNQYIILLASTGVGKEGIASGISKLTNMIARDVPMVLKTMGPSSFASGPALVKTMSDRPCFLSILGEFGLTMQELCDPRASSAQVTLRKALLDLYMKSGSGSILNASVYSDRDKNTDITQSPALSILGESTPEAFFEGLSEAQISEGLLPRFSIYEYFGKRPYLNENLGCPPPKKLVSKLSGLAADVFNMQLNQTHIDVQMTAEVTKTARKFERDTTDMINKEDSDLLAKLWSRADLKIKKLAALLAVGVSTDHPIVTMIEYNWARKQVERDIEAILSRFERGDIGKGEEKQRADLHRIVESYYSKPTAPAGQKAYRDKGVVSLKYLRNALSRLASFKTGNAKVSALLKDVLEAAVQDADLILIPPSQALKEFNTSATLFAIGDSFETGIE